MLPPITGSLYYDGTAFRERQERASGRRDLVPRKTVQITFLTLYPRLA
jgi:hypothetical protein